jgi:riboflavin kinase/FMN adenylyltransferase
MRVIRSLDAIDIDSDVVLTVGTFDGVHRGHQHLLQRLVARAREVCHLSGALTFDPHPRALLRPEAPLTILSSLEERIAMLRRLGLDLLVVQPFTIDLANTPAADFSVELCDRLHMRELWVGAGFVMGRQREGTVSQLQELAHRLGFTLHVVEPLRDDGRPISSTRIRTLLSQGDVSEAARLLGRLYAVSGRVGAGAERGQTLGFRTANLRVSPERTMPASGVYAVWASFCGRRVRGVANLGVRPSFGGGERLLEVHLLDYEGNLYGRILHIEFAQRLRAERFFDDAAGLVGQIRRDIVRARALLIDTTSRG